MYQSLITLNGSITLYIAELYSPTTACSVSDLRNLVDRTDGQPDGGSVQVDRRVTSRKFYVSMSDKSSLAADINWWWFGYMYRVVSHQLQLCFFCVCEWKRVPCYRFWAQEANNLGAQERCVYMNSNGSLADYNCNSTANYVCMKEYDGEFTSVILSKLTTYWMLLITLAWEHVLPLPS